MRLWNAETGDLIGEPISAERHRYFNGASFRSDGLRFVSYEQQGDTPGDYASADGRLQIWDANTGTPIGKPLEGHKGGVRHAAFSPDGTRIVSAGVDGTVRLWNANAYKQLDTPVMSHPNVNAGKKIGVPGTEQARPNFSLSFSAAQVWGLAFSPDGSRVVSSSNEGLRLWNTRNGRSIGSLPLPAQERPIFEVTFNQEGSLVGLSGTGSVILWPGPAMWAELLCSKLTRNISHKQWQEWVSPQIDYQVQCRGLPVPE
jgi:WD40 repeat protein